MSHLAALQAQLAKNRFLPVPPAESRQSGDGDWRAIGAEFLGHFVTFAGLRPDHRMLEIGCGAGRLATPLTQYLTEGSYVGVDIVAPAIAWCQQAITPSYPNFRFHALDFAHPLYNAGGAAQTTAAPLPLPDAAFDVVALVSVLTHLETPELLHYARECARLLAPGGRCFVTAFLVNATARAALRDGGGALAFDPEAAGPVWFADPAAPLAAVAFDEDFFLEKFLRFGLRRRPPAPYGRWSGRTGTTFQDICVFARETE